MAKITKEQYTKWSKQAKNGFSLDLQYYVIWNEKTLTKRIKMADGDVMEFKIEYQRECKQKTNKWGCKCYVETGQYIPMLIVKRWHPTKTGSYMSSGYEEEKPLGEPEQSKKYSILCKLSGEIDTDEYMRKIAT